MNAFAMGGVEILVVLMVSVVVATAVATGIAVIFAWGRSSAKTPGFGAKKIESRLRELEELRESHLVSDEEYQGLRAEILGEI